MSPKLEPWSIMDTRHNGPGVKLIAKLELASPLWLKPLLGYKLCTRAPNGLARKKKMRKCTKNTAKFSKLLELTYNLKIRLMETNHYKDICDINDKARKLYDLYFKEISNDHLIVVNDEGWKARKAHGYLKHFYKQHQKGKK